MTMNLLDRGSHLLLLIFLARLLDPRDFGLMGIALLALHALHRLSQLGFDQALIQRSERNVDRFLNTVWTVNLAREGAVAGILILAAPSSRRCSASRE